MGRSTQSENRRASRRPGAGCAERVWTGCEAVELSEIAARAAGLTDAKVTSDAKHVEIGLTDKADAAHWVFEDLRGRGIAAGLVLIAGDEFGPLGGLPGSDSLLLVPEASRATAVSVGAEPTGTPEAVLALGGGPARFMALLKINSSAGSAGMCPSWTLIPTGRSPPRGSTRSSNVSTSHSCRSRTAASAHEEPGALASCVRAGSGGRRRLRGTRGGHRLGACPEWARLSGELPSTPCFAAG